MAELKVSVEQPAEDTGELHAAVAHPEPAHGVGPDLKVSVEQPAEDAGDPHVAEAHPEPAHGLG